MANKIELFVTMRKETERAIMVDAGTNEFWLPKSMIEIDGDEFPEPGVEFEIVIPEWLAKEKGAI